MLQGEENAHQIDGDDPLGLLGRNLRQALVVMGDAGVVDGDVETAEALDRSRDECLRGRLLRDVASEHLDRTTGAASAAKLRLQGVEPARVAVGDQQPRALLQKGPGDRPAETAGRAGHENGLAGEPPRRDRAHAASRISATAWRASTGTLRP